MKAAIVIFLAVLLSLAVVAPAEPSDVSPDAELRRVRAELATLKRRYEKLEDAARQTPQCRRYWTNKHLDT